MKDLLDFSNSAPLKKKGLNDTDPIVLADVKAEAFRHFLLALLGRYVFIFSASVFQQHNTDCAIGQVILTICVF